MYLKIDLITVLDFELNLLILQYYVYYFSFFWKKVQVKGVDREF